MTEKGKACIEAFNAIADIDEQSEVCDLIYDALYDSNIRQVLHGRLLLEKKERIRELKQKVRDLEARAASQQESLAVKQRKIDDLSKKLMQLSAKTYSTLTTDERREMRKEVTQELMYYEQMKLIESLTRKLNDLQKASGDTDADNVTKTEDLWKDL